MRRQSKSQDDSSFATAYHSVSVIGCMSCSEACHSVFWSACRPLATRAIRQQSVLNSSKSFFNRSYHCERMRRRKSSPWPAAVCLWSCFPNLNPLACRCTVAASAATHCWSWSPRSCSRIPASGRCRRALACQAPLSAASAYCCSTSSASTAARCMRSKSASAAGKDTHFGRTPSRSW